MFTSSSTPSSSVSIVPTWYGELHLPKIDRSTFDQRVTSGRIVDTCSLLKNLLGKMMPPASLRRNTR
jgi:hypothetical protein